MLSHSRRGGDWGSRRVEVDSVSGLGWIVVGDKEGGHVRRGGFVRGSWWWHGTLRWAWIIAVPLKPVSAIEASVAVCHTVLLLLIRHLRIEGGDAKIIKPLRRHAERRVSLDRRRQHRPLGSVSVRTHHGGRAQTSNHWAHSTILLLRNSVASRRRGMLVEEVVAATPESTTTAPLLP